MNLEKTNAFLFHGFPVFIRFICLFRLFVVYLHPEQKNVNMEVTIVQPKPFTPFQIEMLELISRVSSEVEMQDIRRILGRYFAKRAEDALDRLWDEGVLDENVMEEWKKEHMRTPYKQ